MSITYNGDKNKPVSTNSKNKFHPVTGQSVNPEDLYILYLSQSDLQTLLNSATDEKIIFQFFHEQSGKLILEAWPRRKTKDFSGNKFLSETNITCVSITNVDVHLENVRIDAAEYKALKANILNYQYFIFVPTVMPVDTGGTKYIVYTIYGDSLLPSSCSSLHSTAFTGTQITTTANPSPPRPAN